MRLLFLTSGPTIPSTRYRILPYLPRLEAMGFQCDLAHSIPEKYHRFPFIGWRLSHQLRKGIRRFELLQARLRRYDAVILEREIFDDSTWNFEAAFRSRTPRFVLDVDDAIFQKYPQKFAQIAGMADHVMAGNRLLSQECQRHCPHVTIVPTAIDLKEYGWQGFREPGKIPVIGWIGTAANLPYLQVVLPALRELARSRRYVLRIVTSRREELRMLDFEGIPVEFHQWSAQSAVDQIRQFDIGIMPLPDEPWAHYKCGFKLLQYMAAGVPAIASPVGVNQEIVTSGVNGFLAESSQAWYENFESILQNPELASSMVSAGRKTVEERYSIEIQLPHVVSAITGQPPSVSL